MYKIYKKLTDETSDKISAFDLNGKKTEYSVYEYYLLSKIQDNDEKSIIEKIGTSKYSKCKELEILKEKYENIIKGT